MKNKAFSISTLTYVFIFAITAVILVWGSIDIFIDKKINFMFIISVIFMLDFFVFSNRKLFNLSYSPSKKNKRKSIGFIGMLIYFIIFYIFKIKLYLNKNILKKRLYKEIKVWINDNETILK